MEHITKLPNHQHLHALEGPDWLVLSCCANPQKSLVFKIIMVLILVLTLVLTPVLVLTLLVVHLAR